VGDVLRVDLDSMGKAGYNQKLSNFTATSVFSQGDCYAGRLSGIHFLTSRELQIEQRGKPASISFNHGNNSSA
jgi:hypothetical protein